MLLRQIKYFVKVIECNSFTEAAEQCYISQSAISQQINALEKEMGVKLLQREGRRFSLTVSGEHFYRYGRLLLDDAERLQQETKKIDKSLKEHLCLGCPDDYKLQDIYKAIAAFNESYPQMTLEIISGSYDELYDWLKTGKADMVINYRRRLDVRNGYSAAPLTVSRCFVELSARNRLAGAAALEVADLLAVPCIVPVAAAYREQEKSYYENVLEFNNQLIFTDDVEKARLMVVVDKGFLVTDASLGGSTESSQYLCRIPLLQNGQPLERSYCVFWKNENHKTMYINKLTELLQQLEV